MPILTAAQWDAYLSQHPAAHILQTSAWGCLKDEFGWTPVRVQAGLAGAQVLFRRLPLGFRIAYLPKGPLGTGWVDLWPTLDLLCKQRRTILLKVEPDAFSPAGADLAAQLPHFQPASTIQPQSTIIIALKGSEDDWIARMKPKTRYNIRLAERKGVIVRPSQDLETFHRLMLVTGQRDHFGVHSLAYYQRAYQLFSPGDSCALLAAEYEGRVLAMLMVFAHGPRAWYFYGASSDSDRNLMPTYLLQWEAMRWAASHGCHSYDLWGIPDLDEHILEEQFTDQASGLWGVYRFKRGFGGEVVRSVGAWEKIYLPSLYRLYRAYTVRRSGEGG